MTDELGVELWKKHQSAFDRVRSIAVTLSEPRPADWIAQEAHVASNTARDHLNRLVEMNVLQEISGEGAIQYRPDPLYTRLRVLRELLEDRTHDDLIELRATLQEDIETWRAEYNADAPSELRTQAASAETADETRTLRRTANDWELVRYRLRLVEDAIRHYSDYTGTAPASA